MRENLAVLKYLRLQYISLFVVLNHGRSKFTSRDPDLGGRGGEAVEAKSAKVSS